LSDRYLTRGPSPWTLATQKGRLRRGTDPGVRPGPDPKGC
jgi:hypothetical protein